MSGYRLLEIHLGYSSAIIGITIALPDAVYWEQFQANAVVGITSLMIVIFMTAIGFAQLAVGLNRLESMFRIPIAVAALITWSFAAALVGKSVGVSVGVVWCLQIIGGQLLLLGHLRRDKQSTT